MSHCSDWTHRGNAFLSEPGCVCRIVQPSGKQLREEGITQKGTGLFGLMNLDLP